MRGRRKYALWLMPEGEAYERLHGLIHDLSLRYASHAFPPHVTLLGGLSGPEARLKERLFQLAQSTGPLELTLGDLHYLDEYYRCLFVSVHETEAVAHIHGHAKRLFRRRERHVFMPHMSLLYAELPASDKESLVEEIGREWNVRCMVRTVHLYATTGAPDVWYEVCSRPLGEPSA